MNLQSRRTASGASQPSSTPTSTRHRNRTIVPALLALACALSSAQVNAGFPVFDASAFGTQMQQMYKDGLEYVEQGKRWTDTARHYQQQLIKLKKLKIANSQMIDDFTERPTDYGMEDRCPGPAGGLEGLKRQFMPQMDGDIVAQQHGLCQRAVLAENAKYNDSVRMLKTLLKRNQEFSAIDQQRDSVGSNQGDLDANTNEAQRFVIRTQMDLDYWQARMRAYDDYILALENDQSRLARRALEGRKTGSGIGRVVGTDSIKSAFSF